MIEHKTVGVKGLNVVSEEKGIVETIISVTGIVDEVKDRIMPGAYAKTLAKRKPKGVWSHDWDAPVSKTIGVKELMPSDPSLPKVMPNGEPWPKEAGALAVKTQFNLDTQRGKEAYADVVFFGDEQEWSIGYNVPVGGAKIDSKTGVREISTLELYEYSPVLFGAMPLARTTSVKDAQLAMKQLRGSAASWLASQSSAIEEVEIPEAEEGKGMDMDMEEDDMIVEDKERMLSYEQMDLVKQAIEVLRDILDASQDDETEEKGMGMYDKEEMPDEDDEEKKEIIGFDTLTEAIKTMITDANLSQKVLEGMATAAGAFDEAMKTKNMDALDIAGNQLLDMIEMSMESADENTKKILRGIAVTLAEFITKVAGEEDGENKPMEDEKPNEENVEKKVSLSLQELNDFVKYMKGE
jgi:phage head maturation protease